MTKKGMDGVCVDCVSVKRCERKILSYFGFFIYMNLLESLGVKRGYWALPGENKSYQQTKVVCIKNLLSGFGRGVIWFLHI